MSEARSAPGRLPGSWPAVALAALPAAVALPASMAGLALAAHHPLSPALAGIGFALAAAAFWRWPTLSGVALPALLPVLAFAPWSGWIVFEEFDLLLLAAVVGGYAGLATGSRGAAAAGAPRLSPSAALAGALMAASVLLALWRGLADAGGFEFGWFQGYREPMNSLRIAKPFLAALLLWPPMSRRAGPGGPRFGLGMTLGLAAVALAALWERLAYTGLLNFSTDYRSTAMFWETHVGGAALDGFLALTAPFALAELLAARTPLRSLAAATVALLGGYAALTTFSRSVYLALPFGLLLTALLLGRQLRDGVKSRTQGQAQRPTRSRIGSPVGLQATEARSAPGDEPGAEPGRATLWTLLLAAGYALAAVAAFPSGGYRVLAALLGATAVLLAQGSRLARLSPRGALAGLALGALASAAVGAVSWALPKGAYIAYALVATATSVALATRAASASRRSAAYTLAGFIATLAASAAVAAHWGGEPAVGDILPALGGLAALALWAAWPGRSRRRPAQPGRLAWPGSLRWQAATLTLLALVGVGVGVAGGGAYMSGRIAASGADLEVRLRHWREGLAMLHGDEELAFGKGLGRYPATAALAAGPGQQAGDYRLLGAADAGTGEPFLRLSAGTMPLDWGLYLRIVQRVSLPTADADAGPLRVRALVRTVGPAPDPVGIHFELCRKHLLYEADCQLAQRRLPVRAGVWQALDLPLKGPALDAGPWYAPRGAAFAVVVESGGARLDIRQLSLIGGDGRELLANGDFSAGLARWFFTSDRFHLAWHLKNMALNTLFDQGAVGLALLALLTGAALWRTALGSARAHPLAPPLAGALAGFIVVGLTDSLLDVPRLATLFWLLVLLGLGLRVAPMRPAPRSARTPTGAGR